MALNKILLIKCFAIVLMLGLPVANAQLDVQNLLPNANTTIDDDQLQNAQEKGLKVLEEKCKANAGEAWSTAVDNIKQAGEVAKNCTMSFLKKDEFEQKVNEAKKNGKLDEVFKEYCDRKGELLKCVTDFNKAGEPCLEHSEKENLPIVERLFEQLSEFICYRNGDRIALFIAEKGPQCIQANENKVRDCISSITKTNVNVTDLNQFNPTDIAVFKLNFDDTFCRNMDHAKDCIVRELSSCEESTPSNIAEAFFKYIKKALPCNKAVQMEVKATSKASVTAASMLSVIAALMLL